MARREDDEKQQIPPKYRLTPELLAANDEQQRAWSETVKTPLTEQTPKERERARAQILIDTLGEARAAGTELTLTQREQLAEAFAAVGEYEKAARATSDDQKLAEYEKYWQAVWMDDEDWCAHPERHKYIKDTVFSVRDGAERPLLACNACGLWNVQDAPERLVEAQKTRAAVREATRGMDMSQVHRYLESNFRNGR